ncbi:unnamed protein product [Sphagnum jensenii]|jgi:rhodanese-related sulfurtransferase|uniref:Rhodanese domain-containing protein n=1 Tax=Sphagnum jensenii TaxID=128206 RepID=A0ABP1B9D4_9BRYO
MVANQAVVDTKNGDLQNAGSVSVDMTTNTERRSFLLKKYRAHYDELFPGVPEVSSEELIQLLLQPSSAESPIVIDCRSEAEQKVSMFPGAISTKELEANFEEYKDKNLIAYCAIGRRSGMFTKRMLEEHPGLKIRNHIGGILDWTHAGGEFMDPQSREQTNKVHPGGVYHLPSIAIKPDLQVVLPI